VLEIAGLRPHPYDVAKRLLGPSLRTAFPVRVAGLDHLPRRGPVVLAPNHVSIMDSIILALAVPRRITFIAKVEHFDDWRSGWALRLTGQIPLQRGNGVAAVRALAAAGNVLAEGGVVGIYPEGARSRDGKLQRGNSGPARLALKHGAPIVPVGLVGTAAVHAPGEPWPHPFRPASVRFGTPLQPPTGDATRPLLAAITALTEDVMEAIAGLSGQERTDDRTSQLSAA
jgi:1-acyl-sn-glycerol-3-phosphate acyltransferase